MSDPIYLIEGSQGSEKIENFMRTLLIKDLEKRSEKEVEFFHRMYPEGAGKISVNKIPWAIAQCENTEKKKRKE